MEEARRRGSCAFTYICIEPLQYQHWKVVFADAKPPGAWLDLTCWRRCGCGDLYCDASLLYEAPFSGLDPPERPTKRSARARRKDGKLCREGKGGESQTQFGICCTINFRGCTTRQSDPRPSFSQTYQSPRLPGTQRYKPRYACSDPRKLVLGLLLQLLILLWIKRSQSCKHPRMM